MTGQEGLAPGAHYNLVIATRASLLEYVANYADAEMLVQRFGIAPVFDGFGNGDIDWGRTLIDANESDLINLARFLGVMAGEDQQDCDETPTAHVDAYTELVAAETALRDVVRLAVPNWQSQLSDDDVSKLVAKRLEEDKKRDGVAVSQDLAVS